MKLDQHFMTDRTTVKKIAALSGLSKRENVVEIGPGKGALTSEILKSCKTLTLIEKDPELSKNLENRYRSNNKVRIIHGNALEVLEKPSSFDVIISNTPYSISEPLLYKLVFLNLRKAILTLPLSFYVILTTKTSHKQFSRLSLFFRENFTSKKLMEIPREAFRPVPKTESVLVQIKPKKTLFGRILSRRGMKLINSIRESLCDFGMIRRQARTRLAELQIPKNLMQRRVQDIPLETLLILKKTLEKRQNKEQGKQFKYKKQ